jgi:hypothetical protein
MAVFMVLNDNSLFAVDIIDAASGYRSCHSPTNKSIHGNLGLNYCQTNTEFFKESASLGHYDLSKIFRF